VKLISVLALGLVGLLVAAVLALVGYVAVSMVLPHLLGQFLAV
jgi:hypothetical protein